MTKKAPTFTGYGPDQSGHHSEVIKHDAATFEPHCLTCNWRPAEFAKNEPDADLLERRHHFEVAHGVYAIAPRGIGMGPTIAHARDMAQRETTPLRERAEWTRLADEMERQLKTSSRTRSHEILEGQEALDFTEGTQ